MVDPFMVGWIGKYGPQTVTRPFRRRPRGPRPRRRRVTALALSDRPADRRNELRKPGSTRRPGVPAHRAGPRRRGLRPRPSGHRWPAFLIGESSRTWLCGKVERLLAAPR